MRDARCIPILCARKFAPTRRIAMHMSRINNTLNLCLLSAAILATPMIAEARKLDLELERMLPAVAADDTLEVIISFHGEGPITASQLQLLRSLGLKGIALRSLPIAGARATPAQVDALLARPEVRSV